MKSINLLSLYYQHQTKRRYQFYLIAIMSLIFISTIIIGINLHITTKLNQLHLRQYHLLNAIKPTYQTKKIKVKLNLNYMKILDKLGKLFNRHIWLTKIMLGIKTIALYGDALQSNDILTLKRKIKKTFASFMLCKFNINKHHFSLMLSATKICNNKQNA